MVSPDTFKWKPPAFPQPQTAHKADEGMIGITSEPPTWSRTRSNRPVSQTGILVAGSTGGQIACREHYRPLFGDADRVLEVRRERTVGGNNGPSVGLDPRLRATEIEHGLYANCHPRPELHSGPLLAEVRDLGLFVHLSPDAVPDVFANDA